MVTDTAEIGLGLMEYVGKLYTEADKALRLSAVEQHLQAMLDKAIDSISVHVEALTAEQADQSVNIPDVAASKDALRELKAVIHQWSLGELPGSYVQAWQAFAPTLVQLAGDKLTEAHETVKLVQETGSAWVESCLKLHAADGAIKTLADLLVKQVEPALPD